MTFVHCILCIAKKSLLKMAAVAAICKFHKGPFSNGIDRILGALVVVHDNDDDEDHNAAVGLSNVMDLVDIFVFVEKWPKAYIDDSRFQFSVFFLCFATL